MAWWELRVRVEPEEYEEFAEQMLGITSRAFLADPSIGTEVRPEGHEVWVSAQERELLEPRVLWALRNYPSAQINLSIRCYRIKEHAGSPWVERCDCLPGSHPGQNLPPASGGPPLLPPGAHVTGPPPWKLIPENR